MDSRGEKRRISVCLASVVQERNRGIDAIIVPCPLTLFKQIKRTF